VSTDNGVAVLASRKSGISMGVGVTDWKVGNEIYRNVDDSIMLVTYFLLMVAINTNATGNLEFMRGLK
jgi:hypothetical protein